MVKLRLCGMSIAVASLFVGADAQAGSLRCGNRLASQGDSLYEVRSICGAPDAAEQRIVYRTLRRRVPVACEPESKRRHCEIVVEETVEIVVDEWTYDFGRNRFVEHVRFEHGHLVSVTSGGYGHKDPT